MIKTLHITYHEGCRREWRVIGSLIGLDIQEMVPYWGYNISREIADSIYTANRDYFKSFDLVITSDTPPLSRIFLRKDFDRPMIVWVTIMADYEDRASNTTSFPNDGWLEQFNHVEDKYPNVRVASWDQCQIDYARNKGCDFGGRIIKSTGLGVYHIPIKEKSTYNGKFYIPTYFNETKFVDLEDICVSQGVDAVCERYGDYGDLQSALGVIALPYTVRTISFMETLMLGVPYYVPSEKFMNKLIRTNGYWFQGGIKNLKYSVWNEEFPHGGICHFDSFSEISEKTKSIVSSHERVWIRAVCEGLAHIELDKWDKLIKEIV